MMVVAASAASWAAPPVFTLSTNNTPLDRRVLEGLSREVFRRVGYEVRVIVQPSERSLRAADAGEVDGAGMRIAGLSERYRNLLQVSERYVSVTFVAFARRDSTLAIPAGWASLKPHRVGFISGWKILEANAGDARIVSKVNTPEQLFRMLDAGRIDLALYTRADGEMLLGRLGVASIVPLEPSLGHVDMFVYVHRKHERLVPQLVQALRAMKIDGTHRRILNTLGSD